MYFGPLATPRQVNERANVRDDAQRMERAAGKAAPLSIALLAEFISDPADIVTNQPF